MMKKSRHVAGAAFTDCCCDVIEIPDNRVKRKKKNIEKDVTDTNTVVSVIYEGSAQPREIFSLSLYPLYILYIYTAWSVYTYVSISNAVLGTTQLI